ncbi:MAG TPA: hypothetical protein VEU30_08165 [Thermoanaerobaculia bacterium]|nr:hypothetical protein [Thermoanaerobaculia bacterium]
MTRQELTPGLEPQLDALRRLRTSRRVAEIAFFASLWILGIAADGWIGLRELLQPRLPRAVEARSFSGFFATFVERSLRGDDSQAGLRGVS